MNMIFLEKFNRIIRYIEDHLEEEIQYEALADIVGYSSYHFQRLFLLITGMSLADYIRKRRLSRAAVELQDEDSKVIDVALKYGYNSPTAFNRAFKGMHGITPSDVKKEGTVMKALPPFAFDIELKTSKTMEYRIEQVDSFRIVGRKLDTTLEEGICYQEIPKMWQQMIATGGPGEILALMNQQPFGLLGVSDYDPEAETSEFKYFIAVSSDQEVPEGMSDYIVSSATWAIFTCANDNPQALQSLQKSIVMDWLPSSGYEFGRAPDVERYMQDGSVEIWLPVIKR